MLPKIYKDSTQKRKSYRPTLHMYTNVKALDKLLANRIEHYFKKIIYHATTEFIPGMQYSILENTLI